MTNLKTITSLAKRRGFFFPSSTIYGGLANVWDYGPLGVELARNIKNLWWKFFIHQEDNMFGFDAAILMNPQVWVASGHTTSFNDPLVECQSCHKRLRADHLIEDQLKIKVEGLDPQELDKIIQENHLKCPFCGGDKFTPTRKFNLLFKTYIGPVEDNKHQVYLRGETAQGMFVNFLNILNTFSPSLPFGIGQIGKAFRNEITPGNFIFRLIEFNQMEIEYFVPPKEWKKYYQMWEEKIEKWMKMLKVKKSHWRWRQHSKEELSHYSKLTKDTEYLYPFGFKELYGLAYRTDFDLRNHSQQSGQDLRYTDPQTREKFFPHVIEPSFGLERTVLMLLLEHYVEDKENSRVYLDLPPYLAPYTVGVFPLVKNKPKLVQLSKKIYNQLKENFPTTWDNNGNIGKRYRRQDEIGTPYTITVDYQSLEDHTVTIRERNSMKQERLEIVQLVNYLKTKVEGQK